MCTEAGLRRLGVGARAVELRACVLGTSVDRAPDDLGRHIGRVTACKAYEAAGLGPESIDVAEVHDATAVGEVIQVENLGLAPSGEGGLAALRGHTALGGRTPVNPSGGLESKGHPIGATGLAQIFELVTQLRGEAGKRQVECARVAAIAASPAERRNVVGFCRCPVGFSWDKTVVCKRHAERQLWPKPDTDTAPDWLHIRLANGVLAIGPQ